MRESWEEKDFNWKDRKSVSIRVGDTIKKSKKLLFKKENRLNNR